MTIPENKALPGPWIQRAKAYESRGDLGSASIASLLAARRTRDTGGNLSDEWEEALACDQQSEVELLMDNVNQSRHYQQLALDKALEGLSKASE